MVEVVPLFSDRPGPHPRLSLVCISTHLIGVRYLLSNALTVLGRSSTCQIVVDDPSVSRQHAVIEVSALEGTTVRGLETTNGTRLNGKPLGSKPVQLRAGYSLECGNVRFKCVDHDEASFHEALFQRSVIDPDTGLQNKVGFERALTSALERRGSSDITLALLELENFTELGRRHGHVAAIFAVREVASRAKSGLRSRDSLGRYYDDVLGILFPEGYADSAANVVEKIRRGIVAHRFRYEDQDLNVRIRVKHATARANDTSDTLVDRCLTTLKLSRELFEPRSEVSSPVPLQPANPEDSAKTQLVVVWTKVIESLVDLGCLRQAERLSRERKNGRARNELLNIILSNRSHVPGSVIYGMFYQPIASAGIPCAPGLRIPNSQHSALLAPELMASFQRAVDIGWRFLFHGSRATPPWRPAVSNRAIGLLSRASGNSFELALALDAMSVWCDVRPDITIAATGALSDAGAVLPVLHVGEKVMGISEEFAGSPVLFLVPPGSDLGGENIEKLATRGHRFAVVTDLDEASRIAFARSSLTLRPDGSVLRAVINALDALLEEDHDPSRALQLLDHVDLDAVRMHSELDAAQLEARRASAFFQRGEWSRARDSFDMALPVTERRLVELDRDQQARQSGFKIRSFLNACQLLDDQAAVAALEGCLASGHFEAVTLTWGELAEIRGALAALHSRTGNHKQALSYRQQTISTESGAALSRGEESETWSRLVWEATRAGDTQLADHAWSNAVKVADGVGQWMLAHYCRVRQLDASARFEEIVSMLSRAEFQSPNEEAAWLRATNTTEDFGYPVSGTRRVIGRALGECQRAAEAREFLKAVLREALVAREATLVWHGELARIELAIMEARTPAGLETAVTQRAVALARLRTHPPSELFYSDLSVALAAWTPGSDSTALRQAIARVYL